MIRGAKIGVLVVAYNAETTLASTLGRLPEAFASAVDHVLVSDDASSDATLVEASRFQAGSGLPMTVIRQPLNLGYGGNQKFGYRWFLDRGYDIVVLLHGDGQYAPEVIEDLVRPLVERATDAVFGSRMMTPGTARKGGMPAYKYVGNRILTTVQNLVSGLRLTEWHSGYRAYRLDALANLTLDDYSNGFNFDTQIILGLQSAGKQISEVPIPTFYGDEICYVNGVAYASDVLRDVLGERRRRQCARRLAPVLQLPAPSAETSLERVAQRAH